MSLLAPSRADILNTQLKKRTASVAVIGFGYVGLPLARRFMGAGFPVLGVDTDHNLISNLSPAQVQGGNPNLKSFTAVNNFERVNEADVVVICVPTPPSRHREPDISAMTEVTHELSLKLRPGQLIVLESTTYPGTTQELVLPALEISGLVVGRDFFLGYSPERIDLGNLRFDVANTPRVVAGVTPQCAHLAVLLYTIVSGPPHIASSPMVAKLHENIFRCVNIALANELGLLCRCDGH